MNSVALLGIILFPLLGALLNLALFRQNLGRRAIAGLASAAVALAFVATLISLVQRRAAGELHFVISQFDVGGASFQLGLLGDRLSLWFAFVVTGVGLLIHLFSAWYMAEDPSFRRYFAKLNYFIFAMSVLVLADGFIGLLFGWANVGFASYSLIGFWRERPAASAAAVKAFVTNFIGEIGLFLGIFTIYLQFGSLTYSEVFAQAADVAARHPEALTAAALLLLVGAAAKSAQLPLHVWLPDAMQGPTSVSALIHAATMVTAGVYLAARAFPIWQYSETAMLALATVGALSALFGAAVAIGQNDIKRVLAFSTMSQIGYMMLGAGVGAYVPALFHFFTHAFFKALLFLVAGVIIHNLSGEQDMRRMGGLAQRMPFAWKLFLIGTLALAGIPPLAGFFSKDEILTQVLLAGHPVLFTIGIIAAGLTAFYSARLISLVFLGDPSPYAAYAVQPTRRRRRDAEAAAPEVTSLEHDLPWYAKGPLLLLAVASVVAGLIAVPGLPNLPDRFLGGYFAQYAAGALPHGFSALALILSLVVAVAGGYLGWMLYRPGGKLREKAQDARVKPSGALANAFWFDDAYDLIFVETTQGFSQLIGDIVDPKGVDGVVNGLGSLAGSLGGVVRRLQTGFLRRYTLAMFAGLVVVIAYYAWSALTW